MRRYSVLRGNEVLGWFVEREPVMHHGKVVGVSGLLQPRSPHSRLESLMQVTWPWASPKVTQSPLQTIWLGPPAIPVDRRANRSSGDLSSTDAADLSEEDVLRIQADDGSTIEATMITLQHIAIAEDLDPAMARQADAVFGGAREAWEVSYSVHDWGESS